jgi:NADH-quinone oxidoreductase subunit L
MYIFGWLIFITPIVGAFLSFALGRHDRRLAGPIASVSIALSLVFSILAFFRVQSSGPIDNSYSWFFNINAGIYIDHLALVMVLMVSFVSLMIHIFAIYYIGEDPNRHIYFAETALFTSGMLGLVVSSNLVLFFLFWELVGLCSYLLIGFWFFKPNATSAAKKAFIVTRVGDLLFLIGMAILYFSLMGYPGLTAGVSPLDIPFLINHAQSIASYVGPNTLGTVAVLFLGAAAGKSAQFPLHVWIPDAMEGPTTVSALIHAATMVTAGVYLVARVFPIFYYSASFALYSVVAVGAFTAFFAGIIGIVVNDIKRILAYSTISQIGYMMAAIGLGSVIGYSGVSYGMFHLIVHADFKALLFMSAGAILIALMDLRDTREMGGLWRRMPITVTMLFIGSLALVAFPGTAGYFSKDSIINASWIYFQKSGSPYAIIPWLLLAGGALLTALYTFRMFFRVALGKPRSYLAEKAHDPKAYVLIPLMVLAVGALLLGLIQPYFYSYVYSKAVVPSVPIYVEAISITLMAIGIIVTYFIYGTERYKKLNLEDKFGYRLVKNKFYLDRLFTNVIAERFIAAFSGATASFESSYNKGVESVGDGTLSLGSVLRRLQNGVIENYFIFLIIGISVIFIIIELLGVL